MILKTKYFQGRRYYFYEYEWRDKKNNIKHYIKSKLFRTKRDINDASRDIYLSFLRQMEVYER